MADLEELAVKRDRGYLVRLILLLTVGVLVSVFVWRGLTGDHVTGCLAGAFLGQDAKPAPSAPPQ
jgi:hypothetical protein